MNKSAFKKFLTILVVLMLIASMSLMVACNKKPSDEGKKPGDDTKVVDPSFTNGNFLTTSTSDTDKVYPRNPTGWSGSGASASQIKPSDSATAFPAASKTTSGTVSLKGEDYEAYKKSWDNLPIFNKKATTAEGYNVDDNVLMIYNREPTFYNYTSSSFTISKDTDYIITVDVKTSGIAGNPKATLPQNAGARIYLYGSSALYGEFVGIKDTEWTTYKFYVQGSSASSKTVYLMLALGKGDTSSANTSEYLTSGYAFFDNVTLTPIKAESQDTYEKATESNVVKKVTAQIPNGEFDFMSGSNPALFGRKGISNISVYNQINTNPVYFEANKEALGLTDNPGTAPGSIGSNIYMLNSKSKTAIGFSTSEKLYFPRGRAFQVSMYVKTLNVDGGGVSLIMGMASDNASDDIKVSNINTAGEWKKYSFYIYSNQNNASEFFFQYWLGTGNSTETDTHSSGTAFFDKLSITELTIPSNSDFDSTVATASVDDDKFEKRNLTTNISENLISNGYFNQATDGWITAVDKTDSTKYNGFDISKVKTQIVQANGADITIPGIDKVFKNPNTPYKVFNENVFMLYAPNATQYKFDYKLDGNTLTLTPYTAYRFSLWIKTVDVLETAGVGVEIKSGDKSLASFTKLNTKGATDDLNGYKEVVCYFYTDSESYDITFDVSFGTGTKWTSETLFSGEAYIANVSLTKSTYSQYNSASSSSSFAKKYNFIEAQPNSFTNGSFSSYDLSKVEGLTNGGIVGEGADAKLSKNFGVPSGWSITNSTIADSYYGIVDTEKKALLTNLEKTGLINTAEFDKLFFTNPKGSIELFEYCGGNTSLMLASKSVTSKDEFVSLGYKTTNTTTLEANKYYELSVLVKTVDPDSAASVYLITDNKHDNESAFTNISTYSSAVDTNGWKKHTFRIKVGVSSVSVQLGLYLGKNNKPTTLTTESTAEGGVVFFDSVRLQESTKEIFESAIVNSEINEIKNVTFAIDSFGLASDSAHADSKFLSPSGWNGKDNTHKDITATINAGVLNLPTYNFVGMPNEDELRANLVSHAGSNLLIINNKTAGAYAFTGNSKTLSKATYNRISVWAKTYEVPDGQKAYIKLNLPSKFNINEENVFYFNSNEYKRYDFYVATDAENSLGNITVELGLGTLIGESAKYCTGFALFDDVEFATISKEDFEKATIGDFVKKYVDKNDSSVTPEVPAKPDEGAKRPSNFNWLLFSSLIFGAVLIVVLIVYFIKKYLPKRKIIKAKAIDEKAKEEKYNDLNEK